ncbi:DUF3667 domain-containing protein [Novosphingobium sp. RL4]|uniref:DUF3667 domain-containing protein n=1 Tax=Novosphingobium sp. RL4 TaxID=3109595 RepID=UPI002D767095|nr:DUF3667 domain-containing protein [Novosphingobium sp. RL4]WRT95111.1 DUF3667 domain-containing protein [Novosphingobium sp. RL4]
MNEISESLAEIGQGGLIANAAEPHRDAGDTGHTHETACLNCGTALIGSHCHACGQAAHVHRSLGAFFHDLLHGVFHFEGRIWRTLPMLLRRPGRLTREYIDGRRASYVSPIALFLFSVFLMFAVFHAVEDHETIAAAPVESGDFETAVTAGQQKLDGLKAQRRTLRAQGSDTAEVERRIDEQHQALEVLKETRAAVAGNGGEQHFSDIRPLDKAIGKFRKNPELAAYKLQTYAYKYSWALIPISVPFLWLLFPFSRRFHLYDHTVFVTYSLCFMTLLVILGMALQAAGAGFVAGLLFFVPPFHMYAQLRGAYGVGRFGAIWRTVLLGWFASTALLLFFIMIMAQISL